MHGQDLKEGNRFAKDHDRRFSSPILLFFTQTNRKHTMTRHTTTRMHKHIYTHTQNLGHPSLWRPPVLYCNWLSGWPSVATCWPIDFASQCGPTQCRNVCCSASYQTHIYQHIHTQTYVYMHSHSRYWKKTFFLFPSHFTFFPHHPSSKFYGFLWFIFNLLSLSASFYPSVLASSGPSFLSLIPIFPVF